MKGTIRQKQLYMAVALTLPTNAHGAVAAACLNYRPGAELWIMPSGSRFDKHLTLPVEHRLGMLAAFIASLPTGDVRINRTELDAPQLTQTWQTVLQLSEEYPGRSFTYVFGADSYHSMPTWRNGKQLQQELPMLIVPRVGSEPVADTPNATVLPVTTPEVSSTLVRESVAVGKDIGGFVCAGVERYIRQNNLYTPAVIGV